VLSCAYLNTDAGCFPDFDDPMDDINLVGCEDDFGLIMRVVQGSKEIHFNHPSVPHSSGEG